MQYYTKGNILVCQPWNLPSCVLLLFATNLRIFLPAKIRITTPVMPKEILHGSQVSIDLLWRLLSALSCIWLEILFVLLVGEVAAAAALVAVVPTVVVVVDKEVLSGFPLAQRLLNTNPKTKILLCKICHHEVIQFYHALAYAIYLWSNLYSNIQNFVKSVNPCCYRYY